MIAQDKAKELVHKYYIKINDDAPNCSISFKQCKQCTLIAVDQIIKAVPIAPLEISSPVNYWQQVKTEIEKL